jgi:tetratricopeptide (TPR) repeat protein
MRRKQQIHEDVGRAIEELFADALDEFFELLAYHFGRSGNLQKEFQYLRLAAIKASRQNSPWEAFQFRKEALSCLKRQSGTQETKRDELELFISIYRDLLMLDFRPPESELLLKRGEELALNLDDEKGLSHSRSSLFMYYASTGDASAARKYSEYVMSDIKALESLTLTKDQLRIMVPIATDYAQSSLMSGRFSETLSLNLKVLESMEGEKTLGDSTGIPMHEYSTLAALSAGSLALLGDFDSAMMWARKGLNAAIETQNLFAVSIAEAWLGFVLMTRGFGKEAGERFTSAIRGFEQVGAPPSIIAAWWYGLGYTRFLAEDLDGARRCLEKAIGMLLDCQTVFYIAVPYAVLGMIHLAAGDLSSAHSCIEAALDWSQKLGQKHWEGFAKIISGKILAESAMLRAAKAEAQILEGVDILTRFGMKPYCAEGYLYLGELYMTTGRKHVQTNGHGLLVGKNGRILEPYKEFSVMRSGAR